MCSKQRRISFGSVGKIRFAAKLSKAPPEAKFDKNIGNKSNVKKSFSKMINYLCAVLVIERKQTVVL